MFSSLDAAKIYIAVFGRAPEGEGLKFWLEQAIKNNWNLAKLTDAMIEAAAQYPGYENLKVPQNLVKNSLDLIEGTEFYDNLSPISILDTGIF